MLYSYYYCHCISCVATLAVQSVNDDNNNLGSTRSFCRFSYNMLALRFGEKLGSRVPSACGAASTHVPFVYVIFPTTILYVS